MTLLTLLNKLNPFPIVKKAGHTYLIQLEDNGPIYIKTSEVVKFLGVKIKSSEYYSENVSAINAFAGENVYSSGKEPNRIGFKSIKTHETDNNSTNNTDTSVPDNILHHNKLLKIHKEQIDR